MAETNRCWPYHSILIAIRGSRRSSRRRAAVPTTLFLRPQHRAEIQLQNVCPKNFWPRISSRRLKISAGFLRQLESAEPTASRLTHPLALRRGGRERVAVKAGLRRGQGGNAGSRRGRGAERQLHAISLRRQQIADHALAVIPPHDRPPAYCGLRIPFGHSLHSGY